MQYRNPLVGLSSRSWVAIGLCLAHAVAARQALVVLQTYPLYQWRLTSPHGVGAVVAVKLLVLTWPLWLVVLWPLIDKGRRRWVPVVLAIGLACLGWEAIQGAIFLMVQVLEYGNLGN